MWKLELELLVPMKFTGAAATMFETLFEPLPAESSCCYDLVCKFRIFCCCYCWRVRDEVVAGKMYV